MIRTFDKLKKSLITQVLSVIIATATITSGIIIFIFQNKIELIDKQNNIERATLKQNIEKLTQDAKSTKSLSEKDCEKKVEKVVQHLEYLQREHTIEMALLKQEKEHLVQKYDMLKESTQLKEWILLQKNNDLIELIKNKEN